MCGYNFSENALVQGFSPHGGKSATVLERMFQYYGIVSPDVAHVYNQGTDAMSALRYHQNRLFPLIVASELLLQLPKEKG